MPTNEEGVGRADILKIEPAALDKIARGLNLRMELEGVDALAKSIASKGQLMPGVIRRNAAGNLELVAGFRRLAAIEAINADPQAFGVQAAMPFLARMIRLTEEQALVANLAENEDRRNLSPIDRGFAAQQLDRLGWDREKIAAAMRCTAGKVGFYLSLMALPKPARLAIHRGTIPESAGRVLLGLGAEVKEIDALVLELESGKINASDLGARMKAKKRAAGKKQARSLAELRAALNELGTAPALDFLAWIAGEVPDTVLGEIFAERPKAS